MLSALHWAFSLAEIILILSADEFKNDRQMFAFLAAEQRITYKMLIERYKTKIQVYSSRNQNHRPGKFTF